MTKKALLKFTLTLIFLLLSYIPSFATNDVTKEVCLSSVGMNWKTTEEAKNHLLVLAKRGVVGELFGDMIQSMIEVKNYQLTKDDIMSVSIDFIRARGNPEFYSGKGFAELCVKLSAYVTDEDVKLFQPRSVRKKVCITDSRLSLGEIRQTAEKLSRIQAVKEYEPKLEKVKDDIVLGMIHESKTESGGFIPETTTYCTTSTGVVYPIELMAVSKVNSLNAFSSERDLQKDFEKDGILMVTKAKCSYGPRDINELIECVEHDSNNTRGYGDTILSIFDNVSNSKTFGGSKKDISFYFEFLFFANADGEWSFEYALDSGIASGSTIDDNILWFSSRDIWTGDNYEGAFVKDIFLKKGWHLFKLYGVENCCDGSWRLRYKSPSMTMFENVSVKKLKVRCRNNF